MATHRMRRTLLLLALLGLAALTSCEKMRGFPSEKPPIHLVLDMDFQPKLRAQAKAEFDGWADHRASRRPVADSFGRTLVVARGTLPNAALTNRDGNNQFVKNNPLALDHEFQVRGKPMSTIDRGQECFNIHCAVCHGLTGQGGNGNQGHGLVGRKWPAMLPNFHFNAQPGADNRVPNMTDGEYFEVITHGVRTMPAYGARMSVEDRWAIVHYIRALQSLTK